MKKTMFKKWSASVLTAVLTLSLTTSVWVPQASAATTPVQKYGQLSIANGQLVDKNGAPVQLKGMSSHGIQWYGNYVNKDTMKWLRDDWGITVFRVAMYTAENGYISNPSLKNKVKEAVAAAQDLGVYVIIDWHILSDNDPNIYKTQSKAFFSEMAGLYKDSPNVIYELANEPNGGVTWNGQIRPYAQEVTQVIRAKDPDNIIIVGTGTWSQDVHDAADNQLPDKNTMYAVHFYAGTHGQFLRDRIDYALSKKAPVFITEWGTSDASGNGGPFLSESKVWTNFLANRKISWANWSLADKNETSAALQSGASSTGGWTANNLTASGKFVRDEIRLGATTTSTTDPDTTTPPTTGGGDTDHTPPTTGGDTGTTTPTDPTGQLVLQYRNGDSNPTDNAIRPIFNIKNNGSTAVNLSDLKIRYYYSDESQQKQQFFIDWASVGGTHISGAFGTPTIAKATANRYVELSFGSGAGSIPAGGQSGDIQARIHPADWSNYNETNDYSYGANQTALTDWNKASIYNKGTLVWGTTP